MARYNQVRKVKAASTNLLSIDLMNTCKKLSLLVVTCTIVLTGTTTSATEKDPLWEMRSTAQIDWQMSLANLLLDEAAEAKEIILTQRDLQINLVRIQSEKYYFLLNNHPSRIDRSQGHLQWANFEWTEVDEAYLLKSNSKYQKLREENELLTKKSTGHLLWPKLRESFRTIQKTDNYKQINKKLKSTFVEVDRQLKL